MPLNWNSLGNLFGKGKSFRTVPQAIEEWRVSLSARHDKETKIPAAVDLGAREYIVGIGASLPEKCYASTEFRGALVEQPDTTHLLIILQQRDRVITRRLEMIYFALAAEPCEWTLQLFAKVWWI